jgi:Peptidyl-prolyl cis-trans isomerase (rotamase) - cyclophilin family
MKKVLVCALAIALLSAFSVNAAPGAAKPQVKIETTQGVIVAELYPQAAPRTVENFLQYVKDGFYDGTIFHRVIKSFMVQGGGFTKDMQEKTTRPPVVNEADNGLKNETGTLAMARTGDPNSATAQFFINTKNNDDLNFRSKDVQGWGYCVFGKVISGLDVVKLIEGVATASQPPYEDVPRTPVVMTKVTVVQAGSPAAEPAPATKAASAKTAPAKAAAGKTAAAKTAKTSDTITTASGLKYIVTQKGPVGGAKPSKGTKIKVHYTGRLTDGKVFDSSVQRGQPFEFAVGTGSVIAGWDEALIDMTKGEKRTLIIPPKLGYGDRGAAGVIPPNATLIFDVEMIDF